MAKSMRCGCGATMTCDDTTRAGGRWVDIYQCPRCHTRQSVVVQEEAPVRQPAPQRRQEVAPAPPPPQPSPPKAPEADPWLGDFEVSKRPPSSPSEDRSKQLFERALILVADETGAARAAIEEHVMDDVYWTDRRTWDDMAEYPNA